jgi:hypothetical protein
MFTKTDLAKFDNVWDEHPKYVNLGAQKNFSQYAKRIGVEWVKNQHDFNDLYFKRAISRGIIFRATEKIVSAQSWYNGGYRANIVAYTLALMSFSFKDMKKVIDIEPVWINQELTVNMVAAIAQIAYIVHEDINTPPSGISNISEWCKKDYCWIRLQGKVSDVQDIIKDNKIPFKSDKEAVEERGDAKSIRKIDSGIEAQKSVFEISSQEWTKLRVVGVNQALLTKVEVDILNVAEAIPNKIPTVRQSLILMDIIDKLEKEGVSVALN